MIVYNVTVKVEHEIHHAWIEWLKNEHVQEVVATGKFKSAKIFKILAEDEKDGISYSIQYFAESMEDYFDYIHHFANGMRAKGKEKWGDKFVAFRTVLKEIEL